MRDVESNDLAELIEEIKAGKEVRVEFPDGIVKTLTEVDIDDLQLSQAVSGVLEEAYERLTKGDRHLKA